MTDESDESKILPYPFAVPAGRGLAAPVEYAKLRADQPVQRIELPNGRRAWVVSRHADVRTVMSDPRFSTEKTPVSETVKDTPWDGGSGSLLASDPPAHSRLRKLVAATFSKRNIERWRPRVEQLAESLTADMHARSGPVDVVDEYALPLSLTVICELLGVPPEDRHIFHAMSALLLGVTTQGSMAEAATKLTTYLTKLVAEHRERPREDLLSDLIAARDENEDRLTEIELVGLGTTILIAGHVPSSIAISDYIYTLLTNGRWPELAESPELPESAIEELLRFVSVGDIVLPRTANEDLEIAGQLIRKDQLVFPSMVSANEDEAAFERADQFDLRRNPNPHVTFGYGMHYCLGAQLARLEISVALSTLLREFPTLRLAVDPEDVPMRMDTPARGPEKLPVIW